jgi:hypothetical protein
MDIGGTPEIIREGRRCLPDVVGVVVLEEDKEKESVPLVVLEEDEEKESALLVVVMLGRIKFVVDVVAQKIAATRGGRSGDGGRWGEAGEEGHKEPEEGRRERRRRRRLREG